MDALRKVAEGKIDFVGQQSAARLNERILIVTAVIAFLSGFVKQDVWLTAVVFAVGLGVDLLVVLPPWPMYKRYHMQWLPRGAESRRS